MPINFDYTISTTTLYYMDDTEAQLVTILRYLSWHVADFGTIILQ